MARMMSLTLRSPFDPMKDIIWGAIFYSLFRFPTCIHMNRQESSSRPRSTILILIWKVMFASTYSVKTGNLSSTSTLLFMDYIICLRNQILRTLSIMTLLQC